MYEKHEKAIKTDSKWRLIALPLVLSIVIMVAISGLLQVAGTAIFGAPPEGVPINRNSLLEMMITVIIALLLITSLSKVSLADLGFIREGAVSNALKGAGAGVLAISVVSGIVYATGAASVEYVFQMSYVPAILLGLIFFLFQGPLEEIIYRAYLMPHFSKAMGVPASIVLTSLLFTLLHALNPGITVMPIINLTVASVVFSLVYYLTGNMWLTGGAHALWNFCQGILYGTQVSGLTLKETVLHTISDPNMVLINGGHFGFEGGVVTTVVGLILIAVLGYLAKRKHQAGRA